MSDLVLLQSVVIRLVFHAAERNPRAREGGYCTGQGAGSEVHTHTHTTWTPIVAKPVERVQLLNGYYYCIRGEVCVWESALPASGRELLDFPALQRGQVLLQSLQERARSLGGGGRVEDIITKRGEHGRVGRWEKISLSFLYHLFLSHTHVYKHTHTHTPNHPEQLQNEHIILNLLSTSLD